MLLFYLSCPDDGSRHWRHVSHSADDTRFALWILHLEFLMQRLNVVLDSLYELSLVLSDGTTDVWTHKQSIEAGEDAEHLISVLSCAELVSQTGSDSRLHTVNALIISVK